jgi:hypothetical protein
VENEMAAALLHLDPEMLRALAAFSFASTAIFFASFIVHKEPK